MIVIGLNAQAKELLALHAHAVEPPFRADRGPLPALRMGAWSAWADRGRSDRRASLSSVAVEMVLDTPSLVRVSRVRPGRVRWLFQTTQ